MSFSAFSSFLHKLTFQRFKSQLKNLSFVSAFNFSAFRLKKSAKKHEQIWTKYILQKLTTKIKQSAFSKGKITNTNKHALILPLPDSSAAPPSPPSSPPCRCPMPPCRLPPLRSRRYRSHALGCRPHQAR
jgi:hypothetical protein